MAPRGRIGWHKESLALIAGVLVLTLILTVGATLLEPLLDRLSVFGVPAGLFLLSVASPLLLAGAAFWFLFHQAAIDRKYHRIED